MSEIAPVRLLLVTLATIVVQLLLGGLFVSLVAFLLRRAGAGAGGRRRRWIVAWSASSRGLGRIAAFAAAALLLGSIVSGFTRWSVTELYEGAWFRPGWFVALGTLPTAAHLLLLRAGREQLRGRLRAGGVRARLAGELAFVGSAGLLLLVWSDLLYRVSVRRAVVESAEGAGLMLLGGTVAVGCGAFIAVTAGLAAKPRPGGTIAGLLYATGLVALIAAHHVATH